PPFRPTRPPPRPPLLPYTTLFRSRSSRPVYAPRGSELPEGSTLRSTPTFWAAARVSPSIHPNVLGGRKGEPFDPPERFGWQQGRSEEHTSELQSRENLVCRLLLEK